jgi:hypothetical protein
MPIVVVGIDLAKNVFAQNVIALHGVNEVGKSSSFARE